jgi:tetratricopeptide (TPR) repeat protein
MTQDTGHAPETAEHWQLRDEAEFLRRSLEDAAREHEASDLSDDDYAVLRRRDETRLAEVESELALLDRVKGETSSDNVVREAGSDGLQTDVLQTTAEKSRFRGRPWLIALATIAIVAGAVILVSHLTAPRLPGQVGSGSVDLSKDQQVRQWTNQAEVLVQQGKVDEALHLYHEVLTDQPDNPEALSEFGWLVWESGNETSNTTVEAQGRADVEKAVKVSPTFSVAHLYLGTILLQQDHNAKGAAAQYTLFLNEKPPDADVVNAVSFITTAFNEAGLPLPSGIAAIAHDTTTTTAP